MKKILILLLIICLCGCSKTDTNVYNENNTPITSELISTPIGDYKPMDNITSSLTFDKDTMLFHLVINWKGEKGYTATYDNTYTLEYRIPESTKYNFCNPYPQSETQYTTITLLPNTANEITFNVKEDYGEFYSGDYRFTKIFTLINENGNTVQKAGVFEINI